MHELEVELESEQRNKEEVTKEVKRNDRKLKELAMTADEEKKNQLRMHVTIDQLQNKIAAYKRQLDETEEVASLNLAKFRKATAELSEAQERSDQVEMQLARTRSHQRASISMSRECTVAIASEQHQHRGASVRGGSVRRNM